MRRERLKGQRLLGSRRSDGVGRGGEVKAHRGHPAPSQTPLPLGAGKNTDKLTEMERQVLQQSEGYPGESHAPLLSSQSGE